MDQQRSSPCRPPRLADWLLCRCAGEDVRYGAMGDFHELYNRRAGESGVFRARLWYWGQFLKSLPRFMSDTVCWSATMFRNYLLITWRHMCRNRLFSIINVSGLAVGISICLMIFIWALDERSTNQFHEAIDDLYSVQTWQQYGSHRERGFGAPPALSPALQEEYPEVVHAARIKNGETEMLFSVGNKKLKEQVQLADPAIFEMFTFPFVTGDVRGLSGDPFVLVLSEDAAARYFGDKNAVGQEIRVDNDRVFRVAGVMKNIPPQSTIRFDVWAPLEIAALPPRDGYLDTWFNLAFQTYVQLQPGVSMDDFNEKISGRIRRSDPDTILEPFLYPFRDVYLELWGMKERINVLGIIGLFILAIACINFMNLSTAKSARRVKEVGLRKLVGAGRRQLIRQFLGESVLFAILGAALALLLTWLFLPFFGELLGSPHLHRSWASGWIIAGGLAGITLLTGLLAGSYPAFLLSSFRLIRILGHAPALTGSGGLFRKILVITQFVLSIILIVGTMVIYQQTNHLKGLEVGYNREQLISIRLEGDLKKDYSTLKNELRSHPRIQGVTTSSYMMTGVWHNGQNWDWEGRDPNVNPLVTYLQVGPEFKDTLQIDMTRGRFFNADGSSPVNHVVINERLAGIMGLENPVGARLSQGDFSGVIIGVIRDFHFKPVFMPLEPLILFQPGDQTNYMYIRLRSGDIAATLAFVRETVTRLNPAFPFEFNFLDEQLARMYRGFESFRMIMQSAAGLAILVSCLGLFSLAAYMAERRTKEFGVRKVMGASVGQLVRLMSREFILLVAVANVVAWPVAFLLMNMWLESFAVRIPIGWEIFALSGGGTLFIALLTVSWQSFRTARTDPVECLRYE
jgi:predicted permease